MWSLAYFTRLPSRSQPDTPNAKISYLRNVFSCRPTWASAAAMAHTTYTRLKCRRPWTSAASRVGPVLEEPSRLLLSRSLNPIADCRFKYVNVDGIQSFELDAISAHARLAKLFSICLSQVLLVINTKNIDRDTCRVCADANLIKLSGISIGISCGA